MGLYRFILTSHWRSKTRCLLYALLLMLTIGTWFIFQQRNQAEVATTMTTTAQNRALLAGTSNSLLKKFGLASLPAELKHTGNATLNAREKVLTAAAIKGNFGLMADNSGLPTSNRYGTESLTTALQSRHLIATSASATAANGLISTRYGIRDWSYLTSLLPILTSIFGVLTMTIVLMWGELSEIIGHRSQLVAMLPHDKRRLVYTYYLVFLTDLVIFMISIGLVGYVTAHLMGGNMPANYPIIIRTGSHMTTMPIVGVIALSALLYLGACSITYSLIRLGVTLVRQANSILKKALILVVAYWSLLAQLTLSLLPNLFTPNWLLGLPSTYMQASRILFGTDYLRGGQYILSTLNMYTDKDVTSHLFISLSLTNLSYYNGATLANLFNVKHSLIGPAISLLFVGSLLLLLLNASLAHHKNRLA